MIIKSLRVQNYKCIEDSEEFSIEPITCLVGKNESGKTALLQALYKLNPDTPEMGSYISSQEYPKRRYNAYKQRQDSDPDNILTILWELEEKDITKVEAVLGNEALVKKSVVITKGYDNTPYWDIEVDDEKVIKHYLESSGLNLNEFPELLEAKTIGDLIKSIDVSITKMDADKGISDIDKSTYEKRSQLLKTLRKTLADNLSNNDPTDVAIKILSNQLPKFVYFSEYQKMPGQVSINDIRKKIAEKRLDKGDRVFLALLDLVGTDIDKIDKIGKYEELIGELEAISVRLSDEIFEYWSQNRHLSVEFKFDMGRPQDLPPFNSGYVFRTRISNSRHRVTVSFDDRSTGFVWFFSFLIWFSQVKKTYGENLIILLDEPALNLHAKAQADLLRYIKERLMPNYQVIYSTHSPFMIDPDNILAARTVEDKVTNDIIEGTKVGDKIFSTDKDTVFPLQRVLDYEIAQTLYIGKNSILVEGPSDLLYIKAFSDELRRQGREYLNLKWVITPCGGADKMMSFTKLFGANMIHTAALVDYREGQKKKIQQFRDSDFIKSDHLLSADTYAGQPEGDIEDIIGKPFYFDLINKCYNLNGSKLPDSKIQSSDRVLIIVEEHMAKLNNGVKFDHYAPSKLLYENGEKLFKELNGADGALNRFETLFKDLNKLLVQSKQ